MHARLFTNTGLYVVASHQQQTSCWLLFSLSLSLSLSLMLSLSSSLSLSLSLSLPLLVRTYAGREDPTGTSFTLVQRQRRYAWGQRLHFSCLSVIPDAVVVPEDLLEVCIQAAALFTAPLILR